MPSEVSASQSDPAASKLDVIKNILSAALDVISKGWFSLLTLVVMILLFLVLDQTKELVTGIYGDLFLTTVELLSPDYGRQAVFRYGAFFLSSSVLSVAVWHGAFVLVFETDPDRQMESKVQTAVANLYVSTSLLASLVILHYTLISEGDLFAALLSLLAAIFGGGSYLLYRKWRKSISDGTPKKNFRALARLLTLPPIAIISVVVYRLIQTSWQGEDVVMLLETFSLSCFLVAGIIYTGINLFRKATGSGKSVLALAAIAVIGTGVGYIPYPRVIDQVSGTLAVGTLHIASLVSAAALIIYWVRRFRMVRHRRGLVFLIALAILARFVWMDERVGNEELTSLKTTTQSTKLQPGDVSSTAFAIHADGGGLRAALFTAVTLSLADDFTCGEFGRHVYAASGVSGGALGIATWALMRQQYVSAPEEGETSAWDKCRAAEQVQWQNPQNTASLPPGTSLPPFSRILSPSVEGPHVSMFLTETVLDVLLRDHLASAFGIMLTPWPFSSKASRGQQLVESWQSAAKDAIGIEKFLGGYAIKLKDFSGGLAPSPLFLFTSTDVDTGQRIVFSNNNSEPNEYLDMQVGIAVLNSARFPIISPPGLVKHLGAWHRVVDGGFFDNSGADSLNDALNTANFPLRPKMRSRPKKLSLLRINGNPPNLGSNLCAEFYAALTKNGYKPYLSELLWGPTGAPKKERLEALQTDGGRTGSLPDFGGHSAVSAFWYAREARSVEAIAAIKSSENAGYKKINLPAIEEDPLEDFNKTCSIDNLPAFDSANSSLIMCVEDKIKLCNWSKTLRFGPLGWYMSNQSGFDTWRWARSAVWNSAIVKELNRARFAGGH